MSRAVRGRCERQRQTNMVRLPEMTNKLFKVISHDSGASGNINAMKHWKTLLELEHLTRTFVYVFMCVCVFAS